MENLPQEDFLNQDKLPAEIWTIIFELLDSPGHKALTDLRLVCKLWRDVIDDNFEFQPIVNDTKWNVPCQSNFGLVKQCIMKSLVSPLDPQQCLFRKPQFLAKLSLTGHVSHENFMIIISQFTSVKHLTINNCGLSAIDLSTPFTDDEDDHFDRFIGKLAYLKLVIETVRPPYDGTHSPYQLSATKSYLKLMSTDMPNLKTVELYFNEFNLEDSSLVPFLLNHAPCLDTLKLTCLSEYREPTDEFESSSPVYLELKTLRLRTIELDLKHAYFGMANYLQIIKQQRSLEELRLLGSSIKYSDLEDAMTLNGATLRCVEGSFRLPPSLNAGLFRRMEKLNKLNLSFPWSMGDSHDILNLSMLPSSTKILLISRFNCVPAELERTVISLKNLKYLKYNGIDKVDKLDSDQKAFHSNQHFRMSGMFEPSLYLIC